MVFFNVMGVDSLGETEDNLRLPSLTKKLIHVETYKKNHAISKVILLCLVRASLSVLPSVIQSVNTCYGCGGEGLTMKDQNRFIIADAHFCTSLSKQCDKLTFRHVRPVKILISLRIHAV